MTMGDEKPGNAFKSILDKKSALADAAKGTNVGVKPPTKKAVEVKKVVEAEPTPDGKPTKYTIPRFKEEKLSEYSDRLDELQNAWKAKQ
jgi:hypothetical protein